MLARRVVSRPATTLRRGSQLQRRFIFPSRSQLQVLPRLNTWLSKIRFRADGKPRSKLIAFGFGSLILFNLSVLYDLVDVIEDGEIIHGFMARVIYIQHMDTTYDSVNFDDPISTLSYFKEIYQSYSHDSEEEVDQMFEMLMELFKMRTEKASETSAEFQAQHIMRSAAEKIHGAFRELNQDSDSYADTALFVMDVMSKAEQSLSNLMDDYLDEGYTSKHLPVDSRS